MINTSDGYKKAIVASTRRIFAKSIIDIVDPDITYGTVTSSGECNIPNLSNCMTRI